jgi:septal ring factor EnvC (AmiA/AmiB activator)
LPQFGLIAQEVEKISPDLVVHDAQHRIFTVRYDAVNAMLLNEFRKQHARVEAQSRTISQEQAEIAALVSRLDAQSARLDALEQGMVRP